MSKESKELGTSTPKKRKESDSKKQHSEKKTDDTTKSADTAKAADTPAGEEDKQKADVQQPTPLPSIPTLLPLLHSESAEVCM